MRVFVFVLLMIVSGCLSAQNQNRDIILWSDVRRLTIEDFAFDIDDKAVSTTFAQFYMEHNVNGFDFLTKNFNQKVRNNFICSASWIGPSANKELALMYQQTLFDICEIYTREFRKLLKENRRRFWNGVEFVSDLNNQVITEFAKRRTDYETQTEFGNNLLKQHEWELQIRKELDALKDFDYSK